MSVKVDACMSMTIGYDDIRQAIYEYLQKELGPMLISSEVDAIEVELDSIGKEVIPVTNNVVAHIACSIDFGKRSER